MEDIAKVTDEGERERLYRNSIYESLILYTSGCVHTIRDNVLKDILVKIWRR